MDQQVEELLRAAADVWCEHHYGRANADSTQFTRMAERALEQAITRADGMLFAVAGRMTPESQVGMLVAGYVEDYERACNGARPPAAWIAIAGKKIKQALADGEPGDVIAGALYVIANEGKSPQTLQHILADSHLGKERRGVQA